VKALLEQLLTDTSAREGAPETQVAAASRPRLRPGLAARRFNRGKLGEFFAQFF
jgi:hypothetical protein